MKKAKDMSKLHEDREYTMEKGRETKMEKAGKSKIKKASEGTMVDKVRNKAMKDFSGAAVSEEEAKKFEDILENVASKPLFKVPANKKRGGGMAERGMGQAFSKGGAVRGTGAAIRGTRPAKLY